MLRIFGPGADATPLPLTDALKMMADAKRSIDWLGSADDPLLASSPPGHFLSRESVGTNVMRVILHTWFHTGEINAVRQLLGHAEIRFVGKLIGNLEWRSE